jgi:hypothetical protein
MQIFLHHLGALSEPHELCDLHSGHTRWNVIFVKSSGELCLGDRSFS